MSDSSGDKAERQEFARSVVLGLNDTPRWLPCRFLYDAQGSALFEAITRQPEYYPTRTEAAILERHAAAIFEHTGPVSLIELGSGSSLKTDHLLKAYSGSQVVLYVPIDVSDVAIQQASERIAQQHLRVEVSGIVGTYEEAFPLVQHHSPAMVLFLGSTLGNFNQTESLMFWRHVSASLQEGDYFLLGADLVKDRDVLEAAYNDVAGVTAQFTKNLFARMNRELGSDIDLDAVEHVAHYNERWRRVETFARFDTDQTIRIAPLDTSVDIVSGDEIMIEISRKFVLDDLQRFLSAFGLETVEAYTDDRGWFAELLLRRRGG
jgi:L-histidine N-alpha-methyltransferase